MGLDQQKVDRLLARVRREVDEGLSPAVQVAIGYQGEIVVDETYGAPADSRFLVYSATKAFVAAAVWQLVGSGEVRRDARVVEYLPDFGTNGKDVVTVEQLFTHTSGFPYAPMRPDQWGTVEGRRAAYERWRLTFEPGTKFEYHPVNAHWVLADILEAVTGTPYTDAIQQMVTDPLGMRRVLGLSPEQSEGVLDAVGVGELPTPVEMKEAFGFELDLSALIPADVALDSLLVLNDPAARQAGVPGGGGVMRASDLALLYQAFLHDPAGLWAPEVLHAGTQEILVDLPDVMGVVSNRTLGLIVAGDDGNGHLRGFGRTSSPLAFGHRGAGGQLASADPASGISVGYATAGMDQHLIRQNRRDTAIASLAYDLLPD